MAELISKAVITVDDTYDMSGMIDGRLYYFEVFYVSGTGTFTASQKEPNETTFQNLTLPGAPASDMVVTATGVARGFDFRATSSTFRLTVSSASSLVARVSIGAVDHGRS